MKQKIAIIGAGPTGIYTALFLRGLQNCEIHLFEKMEDIGEKLKTTGGGRMNVTNKDFNNSHFFSSNPRKKDHFFKTPWAAKRYELFAELGIRYVWEKKRAILASGNAKKEVSRLKTLLKSQKNCSIYLSTKIESITPLQKNKDNKDIQYSVQTSHNSKLELYDFIILTSGGMFQKGKKQVHKKNTYSLYTQLGHKITSLTPSLSPFFKKEHPLKQASGVGFVGKIFQGTTSITNDILITHAGFSGPAILDFSALCDISKPIYICFLPEWTDEYFKKEIENYIVENLSIRKSLSLVLPKKIVSLLLDFLEIDKHSKWVETSKKNINRIINIFLRYEISKIILAPYQGCWTTKGGVLLDEIHMHTLESKKNSNIYIGGEVLDINGLCGGYHITLAAICGKIISEAITKKLEI